MLRRLFTLLLALACACAPSLAASAPAKHEGEACCCGGQCPCPPTDATAPGSAAPCVSALSPAAVEERAKVAKPAPRNARSARHRLIFSAVAPSAALQARTLPAPAANVALFQAHCSLLI